MTVYLDNNYPKNIAEALRLVHELQSPPDFTIIRTQQIEENNINNAALFLFDRSKKGVDIVTEKHFEAGFKVFAFKLLSSEKLDFYQLSISIIKLWPKMLATMTTEASAFIFTYNYNGKTLRKVKG